MPKKTFTDQVYDADGNVISETTRTESDEEYTRRVIRGMLAPQQFAFYDQAIADWDNADGTANLFALLSSRERDILKALVRHARANSAPESIDEVTHIATLAADFQDRGL